MNDLDLVRPHSIEILHFYQEFFGDVGFEEGIYQFPKVIVVLDLPSRDHSVVICLPHVVIFVVEEIQRCRVVFTLRS